MLVSNHCSDLTLLTAVDRVYGLARYGRKLDRQSDGQEGDSGVAAESGRGYGEWGSGSGFVGDDGWWCSCEFLSIDTGFCSGG